MTAREQMEPRRVSLEPFDPRQGVWVASHSDGSAWIPFQTEIQALRHAVKNAMQVDFVPWGP